MRRVIFFLIVSFPLIVGNSCKLSDYEVEELTLTVGEASFVLAYCGDTRVEEPTMVTIDQILEGEVKIRALPEKLHEGSEIVLPVCRVPMNIGRIKEIDFQNQLVTILMYRPPRSIGK